MQKIVAIGGGKLALRETLAIDRAIVRFTEKSRPRALFIPTASGDSPEYCEIFQSVYGRGLKCSVDVLTLLGSPPAHATMARMIRQADLIYVGGGNTLKMMRRWRRLGVDDLLRKAWRRGCVLSGISAGANCWFEAGSSDSMKFYRAGRLVVHPGEGNGAAAGDLLSALPRGVAGGVVCGADRQARRGGDCAGQPRGDPGSWRHPSGACVVGEWPGVSVAAVARKSGTAGTAGAATVRAPVGSRLRG